jgi:repressor of nif and glnA expression
MPQPVPAGAGFFDRRRKQWALPAGIGPRKMKNESSDKIEKKRLAILSILKEAKAPLGSQKITELMNHMRYDIRERTVRFHLNAMDAAGLTECVGRQGRRITPAGLLELSHARAYEKVGFLAARIDELSFLMNFDLEKKEGTVVVNISLVPRTELESAYSLMLEVFKKRYSMGKLLGLFPEGERVGDFVVPRDAVGIGTVCSITLNGVLVRHGIPVFSRFGGLLEYRSWKPTRFTAIINYDGTTLDPLEIFIKSGMTDYRGATETGNGRIGAGFRELPASSRKRVMDLVQKLDRIGLGGFLEVGFPGRDLFEIPINEGRLGAIVIGGLNPMAILEESGVKVESHALAALIDYRRLFYYTEFEKHFREIAKK